MKNLMMVIYLAVMAFFVFILYGCPAHAADFDDLPAVIVDEEEQEIIPFEEDEQGFEMTSDDMVVETEEDTDDEDLPVVYFNAEDGITVNAGHFIVVSDNVVSRGISEQKMSEPVAIPALDDDITLLAKLIHHEAGNQCRDGKIAVGEVVVNRVKSDKFRQNNIRDIIYAPKQFSGNSEIAGMVPSAEEMDIAEKVIRGVLRVFNNPDVLFFRNPMITSGLKPTEQVDWGRYPWYAAIEDHAFYTVE